MAGLIVLLVVAALVLFTLARTVRIIPQARAGVVERLGRYSRTLTPGLTIVVPFIDRIRDMMDLREQVVSFDPQPVITEDNLVVSIDTVIYFQVTDAKAATYEIANYIQGIEQLTVTTLRNVIGGMALEKTLTSRDEINNQLRGVLDEATGKWGIRVNRVELKAIDTVFRAIHEGDADPKLLAYQYLQVLPQIAQGESNKVWIIPSEVTRALGQLTSALPGGNKTEPGG